MAMPSSSKAPENVYKMNMHSPHYTDLIQINTARELKQKDGDIHSMKNKTSVAIAHLTLVPKHWPWKEYSVHVAAKYGKKRQTFCQPQYLNEHLKINHQI